uniref:Putative secreted protein n=1 Tax=Anopheles marajoara TaxID=58244 RepID=A0A2M4CB27_9DIPT
MKCSSSRRCRLVRFALFASWPSLDPVASVVSSSVFRLSSCSISCSFRLCFAIFCSSFSRFCAIASNSRAFDFGFSSKIVVEGR